MNRIALLRDILLMPSDPAKQRKDMELRQRLAAEVGETIYPEPMGTFTEAED